MGNHGRKPVSREFVDELTLGSFAERRAEISYPYFASTDATWREAFSRLQKEGKITAWVKTLSRPETTGSFPNSIQGGWSANRRLQTVPQLPD
jgi:hypothetical protein